MKKKILITSMGGYGSLSLVTYLNNSIKKNIDFFGTHNDQYLIKRAKKICKKIFLVPEVAKKKSYLNTSLDLIKKHKIDIAIPNSDREVYQFSKFRNKFNSKIFLPNHKDIELCQNKKKFMDFLKDKNLNHPYFINIKKKRDIDIFLKNKNTKKFYIRITKEASDGAYGAAILENKKQLQLWLEIWKNFKNEKETSFTLSDYLPGRTFENLLLFREGELIISKVYENLHYYLTSNAITGAGSTPATAASCNEKKSKFISMETIKIIKEISKQNNSVPNGVYHSSVRYDIDNKPNVTEINIGRFPSTNGLFNLFGKYNIADIYMKILLEKKIKLKNIIDDDLGNRVLISRSLDQNPYVSKINKTGLI
jgi:hypothetical protein